MKESSKQNNMSSTFKQAGSFANSSEISHNKNVMMLVEQVERLTIALEQKLEEVEQLQSKVNQSCKDPMRDDDEEIELLIKTVEDQTQQLALQASKYGELQLAYSQREQQFQMELNQLNNQCLYFQNMVQQLENQLTVQRNSQLKESNSQQFQQLAMIKQQEVNQLQLQVNTLKQELVNERQMANKAYQVELDRITEQEQKKLSQFKEQMRTQLLDYKNQIQNLSYKLNSQDNQNIYQEQLNVQKQHNENLQIQVEQLQLQIISLKSQLAKSERINTTPNYDSVNNVSFIQKKSFQADQIVSQQSVSTKNNRAKQYRITARPDIQVSSIDYEFLRSKK